MLCHLRLTMTLNAVIEWLKLGEDKPKKVHPFRWQAVLIHFKLFKEILIEEHWEKTRTSDRKLND